MSSITIDFITGLAAQVTVHVSSDFFATKTCSFALPSSSQR